MKERFWVMMLLVGITSISISMAVAASECSETIFSDDSMVIDTEDMLEEEETDEIIDSDIFSQGSNSAETIESVGENSDSALYNDKVQNSIELNTYYNAS